MEDRLLQLLKAPPPINVTDDGITILFRLLQSENTIHSIEIRDEGRSIKDKPVQL
jgi:hypothetical protein